MFCCGFLSVSMPRKKKNGGGNFITKSRKPEMNQANVGGFGFPETESPRESWGKNSQLRHVQGAEIVKGLGKERHIRRWP